ncbi:hypothetical protein OXX80_012421 [Metschnikowia pulcherrima]
MRISPSETDEDTELVYVTSPSFIISIKVFVNDNSLEEEGTLNLLQRQLENAPIWKHLMFSIVSAPVSDDVRGDLQLILRCDLIHPILPDLAHTKNVRFLQSLAIRFENWSPHSAVYFEDIFDNFQYLLTSLMLNLEFKYPLVFSYYGKQFVKVNYKSLIKNTTLFATPLDNKSIPDHNIILSAVLRRLQRAILFEFNTLNVMKECDIRPWQASSCRQHQIARVGPDSKKSIKHKGFDLRPLCKDLSAAAKK